jgi:ATP-binding cassette subfamily D (ALD) protein 4
VRSNAESIAFYRGGRIEGEKSDSLLKVLLRSQLSVVHWQFPLNFSTGLFDYTAATISYCLVGVAVFSGDYDGLSVSQLSAAISKNAFISMYLLNNFSTVVDTAVKFSEIIGYTHRIGEMMEFLGQADSPAPSSTSGRGDHLDMSSRASDQHSSLNSEQSCPVVSPDNDVAVVFENLSVAPPHQSSPLIEGLSMKLCKGENVLVLGDTGCGKSSVLRVLRGLWRPMQGRASICCEDRPQSILFLPQRPYLTRGSLLDQITFPEKPKVWDNSLTSYHSNTACAYDSRICEALSLAGLVHLAERLGGLDNAVENWYNIVSPGEMQKIGFGRLFFHQPYFAVLDEATSSLSEENESSFYSTLSQLRITVLSIGHRSTLQKFHKHRLHIHSGTNWTLQEIHKRD